MTEEAADPIILISPTEPPSLRAIGEVSSAVEKKGCDVLVVLPSHRIGIQRKTWIDLVISVDDGRLAGSIPKMDMSVKIIVLEGEARFSSAGRMMVRSNSRRSKHGYTELRHTRESLLGLQFSLRFTHGLDVIRTENLTETTRVVQKIGKWFAKPRHTGVIGSRSGASMGTSAWGTDKEERLFTQKTNALMGFGIGVKTAQNILKANEGKIPLAWTMSEEEMLKVQLVGPSLADRLRRFLE